MGEGWHSQEGNHWVGPARGAMQLQDAQPWVSIRVLGVSVEWVPICSYTRDRDWQGLSIISRDRNEEDGCAQLTGRAPLAEVASRIGVK